MCLIIFAYRADPRFPLVVAANRDEFFTRPTAQADFWQSASGSRILAGKDLQAGGTWLGITPGGGFAAVTNIRDPSQAEAKPRSRGELTSSFLGGKLTATQFCAGLSDSFADYAGYNLLVGDGEQLVYVDNVERTGRVLSRAFTACPTARLNSDWPKVTRGREHLAAAADQRHSPRTDDLLKMMSDPRPAHRVINCLAPACPGILKKALYCRLHSPSRAAVRHPLFDGAAGGGRRRHAFWRSQFR